MKKLLLLLLLFSSQAVYADTQIDFNNGIYHIILDKKKAAKGIDFVTVEDLETNKRIHQVTGATLTINAGFFDPNNKKTISYVNSKTTGDLDPLFNEALILNPQLRNNLDKILNRTEFRVLDCGAKKTFDIVSHDSPLPDGCLLLTSAQGGPMIYPYLRLEEEAFIIKDKDGNIVRESASVLHKTARTLIGLKDGIVHIFIITNENPMTMYEARELVKEYKLDKAMAFDGGSSTSLNYLNKINVISTENNGNDTGRRLKSFMIYKGK